VRLDAAQGSNLWALHQLGSHGPAYFRRYPRAFAHFQPECLHDDLQRCTEQEIANSFDNSLRYTDHMLAQAIAQLRAHADRVDSALIYVSDHGESLGEKGLFLHGMPRAVAPREQLEVPMVVWTSSGLDAARGAASGCMRAALAQAARAPKSHDWLAHTLLGLLDVRTHVYEPSLDMLRPCHS
jgi:lipid A ethanolaminephosphotransferase